MQALTQTQGSRTDAAKLLDMSRRTLHRKLHAYQLEGFLRPAKEESPN